MTGSRSRLARSAAAVLLAWIAASPPAPADHVSREAIRGLLDDARYVDAERRARELLRQVEEVEGRDSLETARALDLLAESLDRAGKSADPETLEAATRALRIKERVVGDADPEAADSLINIGSLAYSAADYVRAREAYARSLAIRERAFGLESPKAAESLSCLGWVFIAGGDYDASRSAFERALGIRERVLPPDHPDLAKTLMGLGAVLERTGDLDGARSSYERALSIRERSLRPDHPETARTVAYLGHYLETVGDYAGALRLTQRAYELRGIVGTSRVSVEAPSTCKKGLRPVIGVL
jgi:tetratricopeptide (TPR) repeat protein